MWSPAAERGEERILYRSWRQMTELKAKARAEFLAEFPADHRSRNVQPADSILGGGRATLISSVLAGSDFQSLVFGNASLDRAA